MLELEYIPLKTPDGAICGHARVRGGFLELSLRTPMRASALVITENGSASGASSARIPVSAQVSAIALHEKDVLRCCGFSRTTALKPTDLRRRLQAMSPAKASAAETIRPAVQPPPEAPVSAAFVEEIAAGIPHFAPAAKPAEKPVARAVPDADSRDATRARAASVYQRLNGAAPAAPPPAPRSSKSPRQPSAKAPAPPSPAPKTAKSAPRPPWPPPPEPDRPWPDPNGHVPPPEPTPPRPNPHEPWPQPPPPEPMPPQPNPHEPWPQPPPPEPMPPRPDPGPPAPPHHHPDGDHEPGLRAADWARDTDAAPPDAAPTPVPNPFPHIFPDAQFIRIGSDDTLLGEWLHGNARAEISAVPGPYSPQPPSNLAGYTRYIRARSGGYWVKVIER